MTGVQTCALPISLPNFEAPITVFPKKGDPENLAATADTVMIEPDLQRVTMIWRVARPLRRNMFEIGQILVGRKGNEWWQQRERVMFPIPIVIEHSNAQVVDEEDSA